MLFTFKYILKLLIFLYWDVHLIGVLLFTKIIIFDIRNSLKFHFGSSSTNES